nr:PREDICTED: uncharacterized protein LOC106703704 [Latimeria chalumnae]|eukprot:XP_014344542.1 PREDICTED: uncharacterized protein LOC106703704 [Latimeria chalumnae]
MSADSGGLLCGQDAHRENSNNIVTDQEMEPVTSKELTKEMMLSGLSELSQQAEEPSTEQEAVQEPAAKDDTRAKSKENINEGASTSGCQSTATGNSSKRQLYSEMLSKADERESAVAEFRRKNVVRLHFVGEDTHSREFDAKKLLLDSLQFTPLQVYALIHISGSREYDISFRSGVYLEKFWEKYSAVQHSPDWENFITVRISQANIKTVTILFKNESVPSLDVLCWLKQHCTVLGDLSSIYDKYRFWVGGYKVRVRLHPTEFGIRHLPNLINIGRDRGFLFYAGQPKTCHKCGSVRHISPDCPKVVCTKCGQQGHFSANCKEEIVCNFCQKKGHLYLHCPDSAHNYFTIKPTIEEQMDRDAEAIFSDFYSPEFEPVATMGDSSTELSMLVENAVATQEVEKGPVKQPGLLKDAEEFLIPCDSNFQCPSGIQDGRPVTSWAASVASASGEESMVEEGPESQTEPILADKTGSVSMDSPAVESTIGKKKK